MATLRSMTVRAGALIFGLLLLALALSSCGFQLRGSGGEYNMPFKSIYLAFPETSSLGTELRRNSVPSADVSGNAR